MDRKKPEKRTWKGWLVEYRKAGRIWDVATYRTRAEALKYAAKAPIGVTASKPIRVEIKET